MIMPPPNEAASKLRAALRGSLALHLAEMKEPVDRKAALDEVCARIIRQIDHRRPAASQAHGPDSLALISEQLEAAAAELMADAEMP